VLAELPIVPHFHGVFLLLLLSHGNMPHLSSGVILQDWWCQVLDRGQILHAKLDQFRSIGPEKEGEPNIRRIIVTRGSNP
jgi:hypothetical protein